MRRLSAVVGRIAALIPESREEEYARINQACIDAIEEHRTEPLEGAPDGALCHQGGVPCPTAGRCPVLNLRSYAR